MIAASLVLFGTLFRVLPHLPNTAPIGATAVLAGRTLPKWKAISLVLATMFLSDFLLARMHGYPVFSLVSLFVYTGFAVQVLISRGLRNARGGSLISAAIGATFFFVASNFGVWLTGGMYPHSLEGLMACYLMALPFFKFTILSDLCWTIILVNLYQVLTARSQRHAAMKFQF